MTSRILLIPAILASIAWFGACSGPLPRGRDGVTAVQFQNMVVPDGLRLVDDAHQSHSEEAGSWRYGRFVYSGIVRPAEAASYVRERMPMHNWELEKDETTDKDPKTTTLRYRCGYYVTEYRFSTVDGLTQLVVDYDTDYTAR